MQVSGSVRFIGLGGALAALAALSACGPKAPPQKTPPPPVVAIPPKPYPPLGAPPNIATPPVDAYGVRRTINTGLSATQTTWNLRSAYNVAALNCTKPEHAAILENYRAYLKAHAKQLTAANKGVDAEFKARIGTAFVKSREAYMTQVYNYFALPPTLPRYATREECEGQWGPEQCRPLNNGGGGSFFGPLATGFMPTARSPRAPHPAGKASPYLGSRPA